MRAFVLHGDFIWSAGPQSPVFRPDAWAVCGPDGRCLGVFDRLPEIYADWPVKDHAGCLILPGYTDLHLHAPQYRNMGLGMDWELLEWLDKLTFPEEARFADPAYARTVWDDFVRELRAGFTTRAAVFASVHTPAAVLLMERLETSGLRTLVGKVSMDRNCPDSLREENAEQALEAVEDWLQSIRGRFKNTAPILTPRFVPNCSMALMEGLGALRDILGLPVQSHLGENPEEVAWVKKLHPECESYTAVYDAAGLLGPDTLMAHCIYLSPAERELMKQRGAWVVHCPSSNANVRSGAAPIREYMDMGLKLGLGSDISGGHSLDMAQVLRQSIETSKLRWRLTGAEGYLSAAEAFYMASRGGGAFFGRVGAFEEGYDFDAVVVDDRAWSEPGEDMGRRFEKMIYRSRAGDVKHKYVAGRRLF